MSEYILTTLWAVIVVVLFVGILVIYSVGGGIAMSEYILTPLWAVIVVVLFVGILVIFVIWRYGWWDNDYGC